MINFSEKMPRRDTMALSGLAGFFLKLSGWKLVGDMPNESKLIICVAPHTTNWDFVHAASFILRYGIKVCIMMKKEAFFWPVDKLWRWLGFVPTDRKAGRSALSDAIDLMRDSDECWLVVTPEGTRSKVKRWKSGFLRISHSANVPIVMLALDYPSKTMTFGPLVYPEGEIDTQLAEIVEYFSDYRGKYV